MVIKMRLDVGSNGLTLVVIMRPHFGIRDHIIRMVHHHHALLSKHKQSTSTSKALSNIEHRTPQSWYSPTMTIIDAFFDLISGKVILYSATCVVIVSCVALLSKYNKLVQMENVAIEKLQRANELFIAHKTCPQEKYVLYIGDKVRLHDLKNNGFVLNGLCGHVDSYIPITDRYLIVNLEGRDKGVSVKAENIEKIVPSEETLADIDPISVIRDHFFAPGMVYEGTIAIPGM